MSTETNTPAAASEAPVVAPVVAPVAAAPPVAQPPIAEPAKPGAKVEMTSDELKRRLDQSRASALADFIKGLGVTDEAALKAAVNDHKRLELEKMSDLEKRDAQIKDLAPKAARAAELEAIVKAVAEEQAAGLTDTMRAAVDQLAGDDPARRIAAIKAFRSALPAAPLVAPAPTPVAPPAAAPKPPIQPGATTAPPPAPSPSGVVSPHIDHLATWTALKERNDGGYSAMQYYNRNTGAIIAAQKARS